jgi:phosphoglycolate phosphatase-like HAD superfamily hydrolase
MTQQASVPKHTESLSLFSSSPYNLATYHDVHLVCWDFDRTILSCHSQGLQFSYTPEHRAELVRKLSDCITPEWVNQFVYLRRKNINQVIVTFADSYHNRKPGVLAGEPLVRAVLRPVLGDTVDDLLIWGFNPDERNQGSERYAVNKGWHLARAMEMYHLEGKPEQVLLVDDSMTNVEDAQAAGHPVWHVQHGRGFRGSFKIAPRVSSK